MPSAPSGTGQLSARPRSQIPDPMTGGGDRSPKSGPRSCGAVPFAAAIAQITALASDESRHGLWCERSCYGHGSHALGGQMMTGGSTEMILMVGYVILMLAIAAVRDAWVHPAYPCSKRSRTAKLTYRRQHDHRSCLHHHLPSPTEYDAELGLIRYRVPPQICNACPVKHHCATSDLGREVVRTVNGGRAPRSSTGIKQSVHSNWSDLPTQKPHSRPRCPICHSSTRVCEACFAALCHSKHALRLNATVPSTRRR
jgi:hypothetical protein